MWTNLGWSNKSSEILFIFSYIHVFLLLVHVVQCEQDICDGAPICKNWQNLCTSQNLHVCCKWENYTQMDNTLEITFCVTVSLFMIRATHSLVHEGTTFPPYLPTISHTFRCSLVFMPEQHTVNDAHCILCSVESRADLIV